MNRTSNHFKHRILAVLLAVVFVLGMIPTNVFAETASHPGVYTVKVTNQETGEPIPGATVSYQILVDNMLKKRATVTTDAKGEAAADKVAEVADAVAAEDNTVVLRFSVSADGFLSKTDAADVSSLTGSIGVSLAADPNADPEPTTPDEDPTDPTDPTEPEQPNYSVSVDVKGNGTATLLHEDGTPATESGFADGTALKLSVAPEANAYIKSVVIAGNTQTIADPQKAEVLPFTIGHANVSISVEFASLVTVSVSKDLVGGVITVNGGTSSLDVVPGTEVTVGVTAQNNESGRYRIKTVSFQTNVPDPNSFETTLKINGDTTLSATFERVVEITVRYNSNGEVLVDNKTVENGAVSIVPSDAGSVTVVAKPVKGYRVSSFAVDGVEEDFTPENDKGYTKEIPTDASHTVTVGFSKNEYTVTASASTGNTLNPVGDKTVLYGESYSLTITPPTGQKIKSVVDNNVAVISGVTANGDDAYIYRLSDVQEDHTIVVSYENSHKAQSSVITWNSADALRTDADANLYVFKKDAENGVTFTTEQTGMRIVTHSGALGSRTAKSVPITQNTKIDKIQIRVDDAFGGYWATVAETTASAPAPEPENPDEVPVVGDEPDIFAPDDATELSMTISFDEAAPVFANDGETFVLPEANAYGFYNSDVAVSFTLKDPKNEAELAYPSGITELTWWVTDDEAGEHVTQEATKITCENEETHTFDVTIDAAKNDSDYVVLHVKAVDAAGNEFEEQTDALKISVAEPIVTVAADTDLVEDPKAEKGFFKSTSRVITLTIENNRKSLFKEEKLLEAIEMTTGAVPALQVSFDEENNKVTVSLLFGQLNADEGEGLYEWALKQYVNAAGNGAKEQDGKYYAVTQDAQGCFESIFNFTLDRTAPSAKLGYGDRVWEDIAAVLSFNIIKKSGTTIVAKDLDDNLTKDEDLKVSYYKTDDIGFLTGTGEGGETVNLSVSDICDKLEALYENGDFQEEPYAFNDQSAEQTAVVYARIVDQAGNAIYRSTDGLIIDHTQILVEINYETQDFYNADISVSGQAVDPKVEVNNHDTYSGIAEIRYKVLKDYKVQGENSYLGTVTQGEGAEGEDGILFRFDTKDSYASMEELVDKQNYELTIDAEKNNSDNVLLILTVVDNAGNETVSTASFNINTNTPKIDVSMSDDLEATNGKYYKAEEGKFRTATITLSGDRASAFNDAINNEPVVNGEAPETGIWVNATDVNGNPIGADVEFSKFTPGEPDGDNVTYTATLTFKSDANYTWGVNYISKAGNASEDVTPEETKTAQNTYDFVVDGIAPEGAVRVDVNFWEKLLDTITFGLFRQDEYLVSVRASDEISPRTARYIAVPDTALIDLEDLEKIFDGTMDKERFSGADYEPKEIALDEDFSKFGPEEIITGNRNFVIYVCLTDAAGNRTFRWSDGHIIDGAKPNINTFEPTNDNRHNEAIEDGVYCYYNGPVTINWSVDDPASGTDSRASYSGLNLIEYWYETDDPSKIEKIPLYSFDKQYAPAPEGVEAPYERDRDDAANAPKQEELWQTKSGTIEIDPAAHNDCKVGVVLHVVDNAGNETTETVYVDIDVTAPVINVEYKDEKNDQAKPGYFTSRTATVTITERDHHFDADVATAGIRVKAVDGYGNPLVTPDENGYIPLDAGVYTVSDWTLTAHAEGESADKDTHTATVKFLQDGNYTVEYFFTDKANNFCGTPEDPHITDTFTIDTTAPVGTVQAMAISTAAEHPYYSTGSHAVNADAAAEIPTFGFWANQSITVQNTAKDVTSPVQLVEYYVQQVETAVNEDGTPAEDPKESEVSTLTFAELETLYKDGAFTATETDLAPADCLDKDGKDKLFDLYTRTADEGDLEYVVYLRVTDAAGNFIYRRTDGLIVDKTHPELDAAAPMILVEPEYWPEKDIFNGDVTFEVTVTEPIINGAYSGLKDAHYEVYNNSINKDVPSYTPEDHLFTFDVENPEKKDLIQSRTFEIKVPADGNNGDEIQVKVYAVDNADNAVDNVQLGSNGYTVININTNTPQIKVDMNEEELPATVYKPEYTNYYRTTETKRTATITISGDRVSAFNPDINNISWNASEKPATGIWINVSDNNGPIEATDIDFSGFKPVPDSEDANHNVEYQATLTFNGDARYEWGINYVSRAENAGVVSVNDGENTFSFVSDSVAPTGSVTVEKNVWSKLLETITFGLFSQNAVAVSVSEEDITSEFFADYIVLPDTQILSEDALDQLYEDNAFTAYAPFNLNPDKRFVVYVRLSDAAGNVKYICSDGHVLDNTAPVIDVLMPQAPVNENVSLTVLAEPDVNNNFFGYYGYFADDVKIDWTVHDNVKNDVDYSGVNSVEYAIVNGDENTPAAPADGWKPLYNFGKNAPVWDDIEAASELSNETVPNGTISVEAKSNNGSHVYVFLRVRDNAGNERIGMVKLAVDVFKPVINVTETEGDLNHQKDLAVDGYYEDRSLTVTINERQEHFIAPVITFVTAEDQELPTDGIIIKATNAKGEIVPEAYEGIVKDWKSEPDKDDEARLADWTVTPNAKNPDQDAQSRVFTFKNDANYTFEVLHNTDKAGNESDDATYGAYMKSFTVDNTAPTGTLFASAFNSKNEVVREGEWTKMIDNLTFGFWANKQMEVKGDALDITSELKTIEYYVQSFDRTNADVLSEALTADELKADAEKPDENGKYKYGFTDISNFTRDAKENAYTFDVHTQKEEQQYLVILRLTDKAGNVTYISTDGLIVDHTKPDADLYAPQIEFTLTNGKASDIYAGDVNVNFSVFEPVEKGTFSGIRSISYQVFNDDKNPAESQTQSAELFNFGTQSSYNEGNPKQEGLFWGVRSRGAKDFEQTNNYLKRTDLTPITVDSKQNNSNNVRVVLTAEDNAGNIATKEISLKIDATPPMIRVDYSNNNVDSGKYYNDRRIATIYVTERNFDPANTTIVVNSSGATIPTPSGWSDVTGQTGFERGANGDGITHAATIEFNRDGDFWFTVDTTDLAGNAAKRFAQEEFTIDLTAPTITVSYDNNVVHPTNPNGEVAKYFDAPRTATITVKEHNFDASRVTVTSGVALAWANTATDTYTATIHYNADGDYTFDISMRDLAGNGNTGVTYNGVATNVFTIDQTRPTLTLGDTLTDGSAYSDDLDPKITFNDNNPNADTHGNFDHCEIVLMKQVLGKTEEVYNNSITHEVNGVSLATLLNKPELFAKVPENDGRYTLTMTAVDKADNQNEGAPVVINFTVNRFGSVYVYGDELVKVLTTNNGEVPEYEGSVGHHKRIEHDLEITEYNPDRLVANTLNIVVTRDGEIVNTEIVEEGSQKAESENEEAFEIKVSPVINEKAEPGESGWLEYHYVLGTEIFAEDGVYKITLSSKDEAENTSTTVSNPTVDRKDNTIDNLEFTVDSTVPEVRNIINMEKDSVDAKDLNVKYEIRDVGGLKKIEVLYNEAEQEPEVKEVYEYQEYDIPDSDQKGYHWVRTQGDPEESEIDHGSLNVFNGEYQLHENDKKQTLTFRATDLADNVTDTATKEFEDSLKESKLYTYYKTLTISTNFFVRWYNNTGLFYGSIGGGVGGAAALVILIAAIKRKKKKA